jgi:hypothetical protein
MLKYENGEYKDMTAEEIAALQQEDVQPSLEERLAMLEALLAERGAV